MFILSETSREMLAIFLIAVTGYLIGRVHIKGISLGSSGIFLAGLLFGHFGVSISPSIQTLGLLLFIASVGLSAGPTFFRQLRTNGRAYILLCITVAAVGAVTCGAIILLAHVDTPLAVGMMAGAFTTSPGLAAAREAVAGEAAAASVSAGYGIIYPVGVVCKVLFIQILPRLLHADMAYERTLIGPPPAAEAPAGRKSFRIEKWGFFAFSLTVVLGALLGAVSIPLPGGGAFSLGTAGGPLIVGLLVGHIGRAGPVDLRPTLSLFGPLKEIGLILFFSSAGAEGGQRLAEILAEYGPSLILYGALLAIIPMTAGYFVSRKLLRLPLLNGLGSLTASMTSTPALAMLVELSGTDDVAAPYATTYPIALITLVLTMQVLVNL